MRLPLNRSDEEFVDGVEHRGSGGNGQDLDVSEDGLHLAFPCGGGNGSGYTVWDFDPLDFDDVSGEWKTGAYPRSAAFRPGGGDVALTDGKRVMLFDDTRHTLLDSWTPTTCSYGTIRELAWSRGGDILYAYTDCGFDKDSGKLSWWLP